MIKQASLLALALLSSNVQANTVKNHHLALVGTVFNWNSSPNAKQNTLTYTFDSCLTGKTGLSRIQQRQAVKVFGQLHKITGINFKQVRMPCKNYADLNFSNENIATVGVSARTTAYRLYSTAKGRLPRVATFISLDSFDYAFLKKPVQGTEGYEVILHEMAHAMGLKHPHDGVIKLKDSMDGTSITVMSYNQVYGQYNRDYTALDKQALQFIYGKDGLGGIGYTISTKTLTQGK